MVRWKEVCSRSFKRKRSELDWRNWDLLKQDGYSVLFVTIRHAISRNSVARVRQVSDGSNGEWGLLMMTDDELYCFFYPDKFKPK